MFYKARIENNEDPKNRQRVQVRVLGIHSFESDEVEKDVLPWAEAALPVTSGRIDEGYGENDVPNVGDWVWIFFEDQYKQNPNYFAIIRTEKDINKDYNQKDKEGNKVNKDRWDNKKIIDKKGTKWNNGKDTINYQINEDGSINLKMDNKKGTVEIDIDTQGNFLIDVSNLTKQASFTLKSTKDITLNSQVGGKVYIGNTPTSPAVNWIGLSAYLKQLETLIMNHTHTGNLSVPVGTPIASLPDVMSINNPLYSPLQSLSLKIPTPKILIDTTETSI